MQNRFSGKYYNKHYNGILIAALKPYALAPPIVVLELRRLSCQIAAALYLIAATLHYF